MRRGATGRAPGPAEGLTGAGFPRAAFFPLRALARYRRLVEDEECRWGL